VAWVVALVVHLAEVFCVLVLNCVFVTNVSFAVFSFSFRVLPRDTCRAKEENKNAFEFFLTFILSIFNPVRPVAIYISRLNSLQQQWGHQRTAHIFQFHFHLYCGVQPGGPRGGGLGI